MGKARKEKGGQEGVEGSWHAERSDGRGSFRGQGCEEEDKGLKAETGGVWGSKASSRSFPGSLILRELHPTHTGVTSPGSFPAPTGSKPCGQGHCCPELR